MKQLLAALRDAYAALLGGRKVLEQESDNG